MLGKKYSTPSSDIIEILAGLDHVDAVLTDLVATLEQVIRSGGTGKQGRVHITTCKLTSSSPAPSEGGSNLYRRGLGRIPDNHYLVLHESRLLSGHHKGPSHVWLLLSSKREDSDKRQLVFETEDAFRASEALLLAGLLANHNKFEVHNLYSVRFADLVNDETMRNILECMASTCTVLRDDYVAILDDRPPGWSIGGTLSYVGLGALAGVKPGVPVLPEEQQIKLFAEQ